MKVKANGKTFTFEDGTSEEVIGQAIDEYFGEQSAATEAAQPAEAAMAEGDMMDAVVEPAKALAAGAAGAVGAGYEGIKAALDPTAPEGAGAEAVETTQSQFAEMGAPETQAGQRGLETVADLFETGIDLARIPISGMGGLVSLLTSLDPDEAADTVKSIKENGLGKTMGKASMDATGSPLWATMTEMLPDFAETALGVNALKATGAAGAANRIVEPMVESAADVAETAGKGIARAEQNLIGKPSTLNPEVNPVARAGVKQKIADDIRNGSTDSSVAKYIIDGAGKIKSDPIAKAAIVQGFDPSVVAAIKGANSVDRQKMLRMLETMKTAKSNSRFSMDNRPSDIAGESLMQRVRHVKDVNKTAGGELDDVAKTLKGSYAEFAPSMRNFYSGLEEMGITINPKTLKPDFEGSVLQGKGMEAPQNVVKNLVSRLSTATRKGKIPDAYDMHMLKKYIDENINWGGKGGEGLKGKTERLVKKLRKDVDNSLDETFPEYNRVNTTYSDTQGALDALQDAAGSKLDFDGKNAEKATGTMLRKLMSNYQNRVNLYDSLREIDVVGRRYDGDFPDDLKTQILFADELDNRFGAIARTSLAGEVGKGVRQAGQTATGQKTLAGMAAEGAGWMADKARGINDDEAFRVMEELIRGQ